MNHNFIPCVKWIRRGVAKSKPEMVHLSKEELKDLVKIAKHDLLETAENLKLEKKSTAETVAEEVKPEPRTENDESEPTPQDEDEFNMQDYDNDEDVQSLVSIGNLISLDDIEDQNSEDHDDEEEDSEKEDDEIKPTDNLIAVGHVNGDTSFLEVYVFNEEDNDLYVHHDVMLPTIPLCMEWLSHDPTQTTAGNLLAIGGMSPEITIWNLDVVNNLEPLSKLGLFSKKKKYQHRNHGHRDAVLDISWNSKLSHVLASGSVDRTVQLWDLDKARSVTQFNKFQEKVQTIQWHPTEVNILLTGACDGFVRLLDCRVEETLNSLHVSGEVEKVVWHPTNQFQALVGTSKGELCCADLRSEKFLWSMQAHSKEITGIGIHQDNPELLVTCSTDQSVKSWNFTKKDPVLVNTKYTKQGLQCLQMCPENPNIFCVGGDGKQNNFSVYNLLTDMQEEKCHQYTSAMEVSEYDQE